MSLKQEIETWVNALEKYDANRFEEALQAFDGIADTSRILFNCGVIHATLGEHDKAVECYQRAVRLDQYLSVAYFQQGVSNFLVGDFEEALANFNDTLLYLRGNTYIDYEQLGLKFKLYSCEALFNRGLCYIYLRQKVAGMGDLSYAAKEKATPDHDVIDDAIREEAEGYTVFSIPVGVVYRPNSAKVKNLKSKDYLGKARLIASADKGNVYTGFAGSENRQRQLTMADTSRDDRPADAISYAASNLVRQDLTSRSRLQSEPPINRNVFPPTPPPESDTQRFANNSQAGAAAGGLSARANSVRNPPSALRATPPRRPAEREPTAAVNEDELISPKSQAGNPAPKSRLGTARTASEPRGPTSKYSISRPGFGPAGGRGRLFMETTPGRNDDNIEETADEYSDDLYDMYRNTSYSNPYTGGPSPYSAAPARDRIRTNTSAYLSDDQRPASARSSLDDFEMMSEGGVRRGPSRRPIDIRAIRVKVHADDDTRYVMVSTTIMFEEFLERVREKLGLRGGFRVKTRDDGDMITIGDRDDWEMAVQTVRKVARREGDDMAKMEVWIQPAA